MRLLLPDRLPLRHLLLSSHGAEFVSPSFHLIFRVHPRKPLCHRHPTGPHPSGLLWTPWTPAKGDSTGGQTQISRSADLGSATVVAVADSLFRVGYCLDSQS